MASVNRRQLPHRADSIPHPSYIGWVFPTAQRQNRLKWMIAPLVMAPHKAMPMNMQVKIKEAPSSLKSAKGSLLRRMFDLLRMLLSSPKGDQGGWEGGARGL
jgi:hypothetical protein